MIQLRLPIVSNELQDAVRHLHEEAGLAWLPQSHLSIVVDDQAQPSIGSFDDLNEFDTVSLYQHSQSIMSC